MEAVISTEEIADIYVNPEYSWDGRLISNPVIPYETHPYKIDVNIGDRVLVRTFNQSKLFFAYPGFCYAENGIECLNLAESKFTLPIPNREYTIAEWARKHNIKLTIQQTLQIAYALRKYCKQEWIKLEHKDNRLPREGARLYPAEVLHANHHEFVKRATSDPKPSPVGNP